MNKVTSTEHRRIVDKGIVTGRVLLFGGVYSNLQALQALKAWADENNYASQNIFCTGDVLGYCAQPTECLALLQEWNIGVIAGNVELQLRNDEDDCGCDFKSGGRCDLFSKNWYAYTRSKITVQHKEWLHSLPHHIRFTYNGHNITLVHGSWFHTAEFIFESTDWSVKLANLKASDSSIIIAGHCGLPFMNAHENQYWVNPGVIGMPANDGTARVWFATIEDTTKQPHFTFHHLNYDHKTASMLMRNNGLPQSYANTLLTGLWDNCEILPPEETALQGVPIVW